MGFNRVDFSLEREMWEGSLKNTLSILITYKLTNEISYYRLKREIFYHYTSFSSY